MSPRLALALTALAEGLGPFLFGVAVAKTIGAEVVSIPLVTGGVILAALISAIFWNLFTWYFGIPSSSSHALIGGLVGAVWIAVGLEAIHLPGLITVIIALFLSPVLGFVAGFLITKLVYFLARDASIKINWFFKNGQILTGIALALSHGANDAQKGMGIIGLALVVTGVTQQFEVPLWVIAVSAATMAVGTASGGWRLINTLGAKFYKIRPVNGFCAQIASSSVILSAALLGGPASTTQVVSSAILGTGSAERINKVRWGETRAILTAWVLTIPATFLVAAVFYLILNSFGVN